MIQDKKVPDWLRKRIFFLPYISDHLPRIGAPMSWNNGYVALAIPYIIAFPPNFSIRKMRKGRIMLNPSVPMKLTNNSGYMDTRFSIYWVT
jgi:hypothetical protein